MKVRLNIFGIAVDRRNKAQLESARAISQALADQALEQLWRERVRAKVDARLNRRVEQFLQTPALTRRQAE